MKLLPFKILSFAIALAAVLLYFGACDKKASLEFELPPLPENIDLITVNRKGNSGVRTKYCFDIVAKNDIDVFRRVYESLSAHLPSPTDLIYGDSELWYFTVTDEKGEELRFDYCHYEDNAYFCIDGFYYKLNDDSLSAVFELGERGASFLSDNWVYPETYSDEYVFFNTRPFIDYLEEHRLKLLNMNCERLGGEWWLEDIIRFAFNEYGELSDELLASIESIGVWAEESEYDDGRRYAAVTLNGVRVTQLHRENGGELISQYVPIEAKTLWGIERLPNLQVLRISNSEVSDIDAVAHCEKLRFLEITSKNLTEPVGCEDLELLFFNGERLKGERADWDKIAKEVKVEECYEY